MKAAVLSAAVILLACLALVSASAADKPTSKPQAVIARGRYLVEAAGMCQDCHTPRNQKGQFVRQQWLQGAPIDFKPVHPVPGWAEASMPIAGLPTFPSDEEAITFFTTGKRSDGRMAAPPMPPYRFNRYDAAAIVAYLRSLGGGLTNVADNGKK